VNSLAGTKEKKENFGRRVQSSKKEKSQIFQQEPLLPQVTTKFMIPEKAIRAVESMPGIEINIHSDYLDNHQI
jgi:hypothetical protein